MRKKVIPFEGKMYIKKGDMVQVISGKDKGRQGRVMRVYPTTGKVLVEGLNVAIKHQKGQPTAANPNPESGKIEKELPLPVCKVMLVNDAGQPTRIRIQRNEDGSRTRIAVKGGNPIPEPEWSRAS
ncbi:MAG: 50S ribosomal protein L24 [Armatimonadaceae bacterium]